MTLEFKQKQNNFGQFLILCLIGFFYTQGKYCQTSNPQSPAVLEMLNFKGENSPGLRRKNALDVE